MRAKVVLDANKEYTACCSKLKFCHVGGGVGRSLGIHSAATSVGSKIFNQGMEVFGEVESQLLVMWAVSAIVLAGTIPPLVWMLERPNNKTTGGSVGIPPLQAMILPDNDDDDGWDNW